MYFQTLQILFVTFFMCGLFQIQSVEFFGKQVVVVVVISRGWLRSGG